MPSRPLDDEDPRVTSWLDDPVRHAYRVYVDFLQGVFSTLEPPLDKWRWSEDPQATKINISSSPPLDAKVVAAGPAIVVDTPGVAPLGTCLGDMGALDMFTGRRVYIDYFAGALPVYALTNQKATAVSLAWLVQQATWTLRTALIGNGRFHNIGRVQTGPPSPPGSLIAGAPDDRSQTVCVPLVVPFTFAFKSAVTPINTPKLGRVDLRLTPRNPEPQAAPRPPQGWSIEEWITAYNRDRGYSMPADPLSLPPPLPTEEAPGRQSGSEVIVRVDLVK